MKSIITSIVSLAVVVAIGTAAGQIALSQDTKATIHYINGPRDDAPILRPGVTLAKGRVALVVTDPQNDFLNPKGVAWGVVGQSVTENKTVENLEGLFKTAKNSDLPVFISPHYYYPHDHQLKFGGALEVLMHNIGMFDRTTSACSTAKRL